jgi:hypothetical protein
MNITIKMTIALMFCILVFSFAGYSQKSKTTINSTKTEYKKFDKIKSSDEDMGTIKGTVTDASTGAALPGVEVVAKNTSDGSLHFTHTNSLGNYTIMHLPAGNYAVRFKLIGFATVEETDVIVKKAAVVTVDAEL